MEIYNIKEKPKYIREYILLCHNEWGKEWKSEESGQKILTKEKEIINRNDKFPILILIDKEELVGFISLMDSDLEERQNLTPWYGTLYIKPKYRGQRLSKILNDEIIKEAKKLKYKKIYLKTDLENFYEKYNFIFLEEVGKEKIYYMDL